MPKFRKLADQHLQQDQNRLRENRQKLRELENEFSKKEEGRLMQHLHDIQDQTRKYARSIDSQARAGSLMRQQLESLTRQLDKKKDIDESQEQNKATRKSILRCEEDLDQLTIKNNEALAHINQLNEQVKVFRSERVIFSVIFKNLEKELMANQTQLRHLLVEKRNLSQALAQPPDPDPAPKPVPPPATLPERLQTPAVPTHKFSKIFSPVKGQPKGKPQIKREEGGVEPQLSSELEEEQFVMACRQLGMDVQEMAARHSSIDAQNEQIYDKMTTIYKDNQELQNKLMAIEREIETIKKSHTVERYRGLTSAEILARKEAYLDNALREQRAVKQAMTQSIWPLAAALGLPEMDDPEQAMARIEECIGRRSEHVQAVKPAERDSEDCSEELGNVLEKVMQEKQSVRLLTLEDFRERSERQLQKLIKRKYRRHQ